jgi:hypothetical protein
VGNALIVQSDMVFKSSRVGVARSSANSPYHIWDSRVRGVGHLASTADEHMEVAPEDINKTWKRMRNSRVDRVTAAHTLVQELTSVRLAQMAGTFERNNEFLLKFLDLAKACLFSGIPEQAIEVYAACYDVAYENSEDKQDTAEFPVVPYLPLIITATRAFLAMNVGKATACTCV